MPVLPSKVRGALWGRWGAAALPVVPPETPKVAMYLFPSWVGRPQERCSPYQAGPGFRCLPAASFRTIIPLSKSHTGVLCN
jgi:hypothetical protein